MKYRVRNRGFIALMSVMIMSAIVLVMIFTLGVSVFFSRFSVLDGENKRVSLALAEACANTAMLKVAQNSSYAPVVGGECVSVSDTCGISGAAKTCRICSVTLTDGSYTILTRAVYKGAYTTLEVQGAVGPTNFLVTKWTELPTYSGAICSIP